MIQAQPTHTASSTTALHPSNARFLDHPKFQLLGRGNRLLERLAWDMDLGLGHEELPARREAGVDLAQKPQLSGHFMRPGRSRPGHRSQGDPARTYGPGCGILCTSPQHVEHLLLEIGGDDPALAPHQLRHGDGEHPHTAAHVHGGHSRPDVWPEDLLRVVEKAAQGK